MDKRSFFTVIYLAFSLLVISFIAITINHINQQGLAVNLIEMLYKAGKITLAVTIGFVLPYSIINQSRHSCPNCKSKWKWDAEDKGEALNTKQLFHFNTGRIHWDLSIIKYAYLWKCSSCSHAKNKYHFKLSFPFVYFK